MIQFNGRKITDVRYNGRKIREIWQDGKIYWRSYVSKLFGVLRSIFHTVSHLRNAKQGFRGGDYEHLDADGRVDLSTNISGRSENASNGIGRVSLSGDYIFGGSERKLSARLKRIGTLIPTYFQGVAKNKFVFRRAFFTLSQKMASKIAVRQTNAASLNSTMPWSIRSGHRLHTSQQASTNLSQTLPEGSAKAKFGGARYIGVMNVRNIISRLRHGAIEAFGRIHPSGTQVFAKRIIAIFSARNQLTTYEASRIGESTIHIDKEAFGEIDFGTHIAKGSADTSDVSAVGTVALKDAALGSIEHAIKSDASGAVRGAAAIIPPSHSGGEFEETKALLSYGLTNKSAVRSEFEEKAALSTGINNRTAVQSEIDGAALLSDRNPFAADGVLPSVFGDHAIIDRREGWIDTVKIGRALIVKQIYTINHYFEGPDLYFDSIQWQMPFYDDGALVITQAYDATNQTEYRLEVK